MLYIFHVDTGATLTFDVKLALQSVAELKEAIERECGVPAGDQVLLMSGGESLEATVRVCSYSAGTDTNPIYLFNNAAILNSVPPVPHTDYSNDVDIVDQINASLGLPPTYATLVARAQLAQQCCAMSREQARTCEKLVHDQHLQQQGWAAVVANLEDIVHSFQSKAESTQQSLMQYLEGRDQIMKLLNNFNCDLATLAKIPILPALQAQNDSYVSIDQPSGSQSDEVQSLLRWISAQDSQRNLEHAAENCLKGLHFFNEHMIEDLKNEINFAIDAASRTELKEIKGLGERLFSLEGLKADVKKTLQEQCELAQGFLQNQTRANNLGDPSILPDLCASHRRQLIVMMENHSKLRDIRRRVTKAKEELSFNLHHRLKFIRLTEMRLIDLERKLVLYFESLKRLKRHQELLEQIHLTPQMYMNAVVEVVRRRRFSEAFLVWAGNLACHLYQVHNEEMNRRREFQAKFEGHFLNDLFPGLEDTPPPFATQAPTVFDSELPKLTIEDMEYLKGQLPELTDSVPAHDLNSVTQFFISKSSTDASMDGNKDKDSSISMPVDIPAREPSERLPMATDRIGFESVTDTDEFEKIIQDGDEKTVCYENKEKLQKQLEENLGNTRAEVERLRSILRTLKTLMTETMSAFRTELTVLREKVDGDKNGIHEIVERIGQAMVLHSEECERVLREREHALTTDHELELDAVKRMLQERDEEIGSLRFSIIEKNLEIAEYERLVSIMRQQLENNPEEMKVIRKIQNRCQEKLTEAIVSAQIEKENAIKESNESHILEVASLTSTLDHYRQNIKELEEALAATKAEQEKLIKEAVDKLQTEHKTEIETIRSRFKLMTASTMMERSPSDSSLEKIERPDLIELANHEAILAQTKENLNAEKDAAIQEAIEKKTSDFEAKLQYGLRLAEKQMGEAAEAYRARETVLVKQCEQYREFIERLTEQDRKVNQALSEKVKHLEDEKHYLEKKMAADRELLHKREAMFYVLQENHTELQRKLSESRTIGSLTTSAIVDDALKTLMSTSADEMEVSESKKVRLDTPDTTSESLTKRLGLLECDNKRLTVTLQAYQESRQSMKARLEALEADKARLEAELTRERLGRNYSSMSSSVALVSDTNSQEAGLSSLDSSGQDTSYGRRDKLIRNPCCHHHGVQVFSCNPGDVVAVIWDHTYNNYAILQQANALYFLNSECIDALDLRNQPVGQSKHKLVVGQVIDKQYCHAKKPENRYHVPQGTKFYHVRVRPFPGNTDQTTSLSNKSQQ